MSLEAYMNKVRPTITDQQYLQTFDDIMCIVKSLETVQDQWMCKKAGVTLRSIIELSNTMMMCLDGYVLEDSSQNPLLWVLMVIDYRKPDKKLFNKAFGNKGKGIDVELINSQRKECEPKFDKLLRAYEAAKPLIDSKKGSTIVKNDV